MLLKLIAAMPLLAKSAMAVAIQAPTYKNMAYYTNWDIGTPTNYPPQDLNVDYLTHVIYAFGKIKENGEVVSSNEYVDFLNLLDGDDPNEEGNNAYGNIKQLYIHKKKNRNLKTLFSIGGWGYSEDGQFDYALKNETTMARFCTSAVRLMADWGFDGIDIDYEYPTTWEQGEKFYQLIKKCRASLDSYAQVQGQDYHYLLTMATSANLLNYQYLDFSKFTNRVDHVLLMAYDYVGPIWSPVTGHQANMYVDKENTAATPLNTQDVVADYFGKGLDRNKLILGLPLYGRSFANTTGLGKAYGGTEDGSGVGGGDEEPGVYLFKNLPQPGAKVMTKPGIMATYTYDSKTTEYVTFDGRDSTRMKAGYIKDKALGGAFFWRAAGDKTGSSSLVKVMSDAMGSKDKSYNQLSYPASRFDNIKNGMPGV